MTRFSFQIGTPTGAIQTLEVEGETPEAARRSLEAKGYYIFAPPASSATAPRRPALPRPLLGGRIGGRTLLVFNQEFAALVKAGLPILASLDLLSQRSQHPRLREILGEVREAVKGGAALSASLARYPRIFSPLYTATLQAGEQSGNFVEAIVRFVEYQKRLLGMRQRFRAALTYPAILCLASAAVILFLLAYVVPTFTQIYGDMEAQLPRATRLLVALTSRLRDALPLGAGAGLCLGLAGWWFYRSPAGARLADRWALSLPWVGGLIQGYAFSRFARTLSMTLGGGIPMIPALETTLGTVGNQHVTQAIRGVIPRVAAGSSLEGALAESGAVPPLVLELVAVGESSGSLGEMLAHVADLFEAEMDAKLTTLAAAIEPLIMIGMGLVVATVVVIMYLPIFHLASAVR